MNLTVKSIAHNNNHMVQFVELKQRQKFENNNNESIITLCAYLANSRRQYIINIKTLEI